MVPYAHMHNAYMRKVFVGCCSKLFLQLRSCTQHVIPVGNEQHTLHVRIASHERSCGTDRVSQCVCLGIVGRMHLHNSCFDGAGMKGREFLSLRSISAHYKWRLKMFGFLDRTINATVVKRFCPIKGPTKHDHNIRRHGTSPKERWASLRLCWFLYKTTACIRPGTNHRERRILCWCESSITDINNGPRGRTEKL